MHLMERPLSKQERDNMIDMLEGCKNRICVTDDYDELLRLVHGANSYIFQLAYSRYLQLKEKRGNINEQ